MMVGLCDVCIQISVFFCLFSDCADFFQACKQHFADAPPPVEAKSLADRNFAMRLNRDDAIHTALSGIYNRWRQTCVDIYPNPPRRVPLLATFSGPGGGKSFFCDEVLACRPDDVDRFIEKSKLDGGEVSAFQHALRNKLGLAITFNDFMPINPFHRFECEINACVSVRLLVSYAPQHFFFSAS
jgi:hypothetical protein